MLLRKCLGLGAKVKFFRYEKTKCTRGMKNAQGELKNTEEELKKLDKDIKNLKIIKNLLAQKPKK
jgi:hypothetical protein